MTNMFTHLHCHSNYSLLSGADRIETLLDKAKTLGMKALAITDTNALYGAIPFYKAAVEREIKPIIGVEIDDGKSRAVLLAKNEKGYSNLCQIITERKLGSHKLSPPLMGGVGEGDSIDISPSPSLSLQGRGDYFSLFSSLRNHKDGLVVITKSLNLLRKPQHGTTYH